MNSTRFLNDKVVSDIKNKKCLLQALNMYILDLVTVNFLKGSAKAKLRPVGKVEFYKNVVVINCHYYYF